MNLLPGRRIIANQNMQRTILAILMLCPLSALAQTTPPDPMSLPARDAHQDLTIVADPYVRASRYSKEVFGKNSFYAAGIVAIDVYFRNDNNVPIRLNPGTIQLVISQPDQDRQRLEPLSPEDVADRTLLTANSNIRARRPFPFPGSSDSGHSKNWTEMATTLRSIALGTDVLPPHATTHGFLFFDMNHDFDAIHYTHLYIPDLAFMTNDHKALFFFEIDLGESPSK